MLEDQIEKKTWKCLEILELSGGIEWGMALSKGSAQVWPMGWSLLGVRWTQVQWKQGEEKGRGRKQPGLKGLVGHDGRSLGPILYAMAFYRSFKGFQ